MHDKRCVRRGYTTLAESLFAADAIVFESVFARSLADSVRHGDFFGLFRDGILFEVTRPVKTHAAASGVAVVVGVACGMAAAAFTFFTLKWCVMSVLYADVASSRVH